MSMYVFSEKCARFENQEYFFLSYKLITSLAEASSPLIGSELSGGAIQLIITLVFFILLSKSWA